MSTPKTVILFADRNGEELAPLNATYPVALLPLVGKSPLEFWLESLSEIKVAEIFVVVGPHAQQIRSALADGAHWGVKIHYLSSRGQENPVDLITRNLSTLPQSFAAARADQLPVASKLIPDQLIALSSTDYDRAAALRWRADSDNSATLSTLRQVADLCVRILNNRFGHTVPRGLMNGQGTWLATPNFAPERCQLTEGALYIGRDTMVHDTAVLAENVIIENNCFIDKGATLSNAIIFPGSYIGQNVSVEDSMVCGTLLINLKTNSAIQIGDPALIAHITPQSGLVRTTKTERLLAILLIALTSPIVYPLALLSRVTSGPLVDKQIARSNRGSRSYPIDFELMSLNTRLNWLRHWPQLFHVIDGHLKLFGSKIEHDNTELALPDLPLSQGVFTPTDLFRSQTLDDTEQQLWGLELANENPRLGVAFYRVCKAVFGRIFA